VKPSCRGQGVISYLITTLTASGEQSLGVKSSSLFVLADNNSAIQAYLKSGFSFATYPEKISLKNCLYMVKE
jgi:ribosomal protein S18 acetylase RimI-like enzyme